MAHTLPIFLEKVQIGTAEADCPDGYLNLSKERLNYFNTKLGTRGNIKSFSINLHPCFSMEFGSDLPKLHSFMSEVITGSRIQVKKDCYLIEDSQCYLYYVTAETTDEAFKKFKEVRSGVTIKSIQRLRGHVIV